MTGRVAAGNRRFLGQGPKVGGNPRRFPCHDKRKVVQHTQKNKKTDERKTKRQTKEKNKPTKEKQKDGRKKKRVVQVGYNVAN